MGSTVITAINLADSRKMIDFNGIHTLDLHRIDLIGGEEIAFEFFYTFKIVFFPHHHSKMRALRDSCWLENGTKITNVSPKGYDNLWIP